MENASVVDLELRDDPDLGSLATSVTMSESGRKIPLDAVVLATGGFSADLGPAGLVKELSMTAAKCPFTTNGPFATGDLLKIGRRLGFDTVDLNQVQVCDKGKQML